MICTLKQESVGGKHVRQDSLKFVVIVINAIEEINVASCTSNLPVKDAKSSQRIAIIVSFA